MSSVWKQYRFRDVLTEVQNGLYKSAEFYGRGKPFIRMYNLGNTSWKLNTELLAQVCADDREVDNFSLKLDDILINRVNSVELLGKVGLIDETSEGSLFENMLIRLRCIDQVHPHFLVQYMLTNNFRLQVRKAAKRAGGQASISSEDIRNFRVLLPPLAEQRKIAAILGTWDAAIDRAERLVAALKARKKALMQRLLTGEMRFPGFGETGTNGILLDGWQEYRLDQIFKRVQRPASEPEHVLSITAKVGFVDQAAKFGRIIAGKTLERYTLLRKGEFAYNKGNSGSYPQGCIYRLEEFDEGAVPNVYYCFAPKRPDVDSDFYKFYFESGALNRQLSRLINSGVRNDGLLNLSAEEFFGIKVLMPPPPEQAAVGSVLTCADNEIGVASQNLAALRAQKRGLMQRLLTGEVRVAVDG